MHPRPHQVVARRLGRRIRTVGRVGGRLRESRVLRSKRPIDLIGGDVHKTKAFTLRALQRPVERQRSLQQRKRAADVGAQKRLRPDNGPVYMALRRKVNHRPRPILLHQLRHQVLIADITLDKRVPFFARERRQVGRIAGIGQSIQVHHPRPGCRAAIVRTKPVENEVRTDEARPARHQKTIRHLHSFLRAHREPSRCPHGSIQTRPQSRSVGHGRDTPGSAEARPQGPHPVRMTSASTPQTTVSTASSACNFCCSATQYVMPSAQAVTTQGYVRFNCAPHRWLTGCMSARFLIFDGTACRRR